ncbi:MAG: putative signal transducing protein [Bacteroidota bacterium]
MVDWQKVYQDSQQYRVEIVKAILEEHELDPVIVDKKDSAYQWGHFELHVTADQVIRAIKIISEEVKL